MILKKIGCNIILTDKRDNMKTMYKGLFGLLFLAIAAVGCSGNKKVVSNFSKEAITDAINKNEWVFTSNYVMPQSGRSRSVNGPYNVTYSANKLIVYLPYFGRAYTATIGSTQGPLDFKSSDFDISKDQTKEGQWTLVLKPKDYREVQTMTFTFFDNGSANLAVILTNRSPISFSGTVAPKPAN
jgi:hypothetical protein